MTIHRNSPDLLLHTQDMMIAAIEERWDDLIDMQLTQDKMLKALFSTTYITFFDLAKNNLGEIQRLNQNILSLAQNRTTSVTEELVKVSQKQRLTFNHEESCAA